MGHLKGIKKLIILFLLIFTLILAGCAGEPQRNHLIGEMQKMQGRANIQEVITAWGTETHLTPMGNFITYTWVDGTDFECSILTDPNGRILFVSHDGTEKGFERYASLLSKRNRK